jgi:hypothetical protein
MSPFFGFGEEPTQTRVQLALFPALELIISLRDLINGLRDDVLFSEG